jgi:hypothetical protein
MLCRQNTLKELFMTPPDEIISRRTGSYSKKVPLSRRKHENSLGLENGHYNAIELLLNLQRNHKVSI